jgi:hypothetical protein
MWTILGALLPSVFTTISSITAAISNAKIAAINATTDQDRIAAEEEVATLQTKRDVLIADASQSKIDLYMRSLIAIGPAVYLAKIFIYDKVLQQWTLAETDKLDPNLWNVVMVVLGFYFLATASISISKILKS